MIRARSRKLAILGGAPAFSEQLHVGRPNIGDRDRLLERIGRILDSKWLTNTGPFVREFEARIAEFLGVRNFIATCNGTIGLEIAIRALGMKGEVIVPSNTFIATAHALQWQEITPLFCDIDPHTYNIDPERVEARITSRTTGILAVHVWGRPCAIEALAEIAHRRDLRLLFDASHAFACSYRGRMIGNFGDAEVFSFHATKFFNTFEGGGIATNDDDLASRIRLMKNFGFSGYDEVSRIGTNGKMTEVSAVMGLTSFESIDHFIEVNRQNYCTYREMLEGIPGVTLVRYDDAERCNYHYVVLDVDPDLAQLTRDELVEVLHADNVLARRYFWPGCHRMEPYHSYFPHVGLLLPQTDRILPRILLLPTGTSIDRSMIVTMCDIIATALSQADEVRRVLALKNIHGD